MTNVTHYLIFADRTAHGINATNEADAMAQAAAMGVADAVVRVDVAMTQAEWDAATLRHRDYAAELEAARVAGDWDAHAEIWEARRMASVEADEASLVEGETHLATWSELTDGEKAEARFRGFPMDAVFTVKKRYGDMDWKLVRWTRGTPKRDANGIIRSVGA